MYRMVLIIILLVVTTAAFGGDKASERARKELQEDIKSACNDNLPARLTQLCERYRDRYKALPDNRCCGMTEEIFCDGVYKLGATWDDIKDGACRTHTTAPCCKDEAAFAAYEKTSKLHEQRGWVAIPPGWGGPGDSPYLQSWWRECNKIYEEGGDWPPQCAALGLIAPKRRPDKKQ